MRMIKSIVATTKFKPNYLNIKELIDKLALFHNEIIFCLLINIFVYDS